MQLKNPHRDRYKKEPRPNDDWNNAINYGIKGLKRVYGEMKRRGKEASDKKELGRIYIYGFLAASIYLSDPFRFCENAQEARKPKEPNLTTKLAMQKRPNAILKTYKLLPEIRADNPWADIRCQ